VISWFSSKFADFNHVCRYASGLAIDFDEATAEVQKVVSDRYNKIRAAVGLCKLSSVDP
jgi:hypothetical protein